MEVCSWRAYLTDSPFPVYLPLVPPYASICHNRCLGGVRYSGKTKRMAAQKMVGDVGQAAMLNAPQSRSSCKILFTNTPQGHLPFEKAERITLLDVFNNVKTGCSLTGAAISNRMGNALFLKLRETTTGKSRIRLGHEGFGPVWNGKSRHTQAVLPSMSAC